MRRPPSALLFVLALLAAACGGTTVDLALEVTGPGGSLTLDMDDLKDLPVTEGWGGFVSSTGEITIPERFQGVSLADLADQVGGIEQGTGLTVLAKDGYAMTLSYDQAINGAFIAYDPSTGAEITPSGRLRPIIAYARDGEPIGDDGPLRLEVVSDERDQVVDGHWTVKWVTAIEVKPLGVEWTLELEGLTDESMDRGTFESGANCHEASWTDDEGHVYTGIPLWLLAGRLDGGNPHGDDAYDDALAEAGYTIEVIAADGYRATIESASFHRNDAILVANQMDGEALSEDEFPLRLVGEGLTGGQMVSQVTALVGHFDGEEAGDDGEAGQAVPAGDAALAIAGAVAQEVTLSAATVGEFEVVTVTVEHPEDGDLNFTGVRLGELLEAAGPDAGTATLIFTASDGYSIRVGLADARACADCLVAFHEEGFDLAMPDMELGAWVKDVISIEVQ